MKSTVSSCLMLSLGLGLGLLTASPAYADPDAVSVADYEEDAKALIGKFDTPPWFGFTKGLSVIVEASLDQLKYRNGNSHKVWFKPESSKVIVVFVKDIATGNGITNSAPNIAISNCLSGPGSFSLTDGDLPLTCSWRLGVGPNRLTGTFEFGFKRGGPGAKARAATGGDTPTITEDAKTFTGKFNFDGFDYTVSVDADRIRFRNGSSHREFAIPESHKKSDGGFSAVGPGFRVRCPFDSPGVEAYDGKAKITCTWKAGNGSKAPTGTVVLE